LIDPSRVENDRAASAMSAPLFFRSGRQDAAEIARRRRHPAGETLRLRDADDGARAQLKAARIAFARQPT